MNDDTINRKEAINAVLRNLNEEKYRSSWESGAVKVMKDTLEKMPTENRPVNGVLFKGRLEEGDYKLIKTTDGWVLVGKDIAFAGSDITDRPQGSWESWWNEDLSRWGARCTNCHKWSSAYFDFCPNCGCAMTKESE